MSGRPRIELSAVQVIASAAAAATGAIVTSWLGAGGTIAGTAIGSAASTLGFAVYNHYLRRARDKVTPVIVEHARVRIQAPGELSGQKPAGPARRPGTLQGRSTAHGAAAQAGTSGAPGATRGAFLSGWPGWAKLVVSSAAIFSAVMIAITTVELATGRPITASIWGHPGSGTTIGNVVTGNPGLATTASQPSGSTAPSQPSDPTAGQPGKPTAGQTTPKPFPDASTAPVPGPTASGGPAPSPIATSPATVTAPAPPDPAGGAVHGTTPPRPPSPAPG